MKNGERGTMRFSQTRDGVYLFLKLQVFGEDRMSAHSPSEKPSEGETAADTEQRSRTGLLLREAEGKPEGGWTDIGIGRAD